MKIKVKMRAPHKHRMYIGGVWVEVDGCEVDVDEHQARVLNSHTWVDVVSDLAPAKKDEPKPTNNHGGEKDWEAPPSVDSSVDKDSEDTNPDRPMKKRRKKED